MTGIATIFLLLNSVALLVLPRRWAPFPLLLGACYMTMGQGIALGPFHFTVLRLLSLIGLIRVLVRGERLSGGLCGLDRVMLLWGACLAFSGVFHNPPNDALVYRFGLVYNAFGTYFLLRVFCQSIDDLTHLIKLTAFLLVPIALEMVNERMTQRNLFSVLGGVPEFVAIREGKLRAQGPFGHAILGGTVGAICVPLMVGIWRQHPWVARIGLAACLVITVASNSSGPLMSVIFGLFALGLWRWRHLTRQMRRGAVLAYLMLSVVMKDPPYYLMARIDLTGSSTGYHRARLIEVAFDHIGDWWLTGTDYTRHWMPYGVSWSENHVDFTNLYLQNGVWGGLPVMLLLIAGFVVAFRYVGVLLRLREESPFADQFLVWSLGAMLFAHTATCISVSYFDQSITFLYLTLAAIGSLHSATLAELHGDASFPPEAAVEGEDMPTASAGVILQSASTIAQSVCPTSA